MRTAKLLQPLAPLLLFMSPLIFNSCKSKGERTTKTELTIQDVKQADSVPEPPPPPQGPVPGVEEMKAIEKCFTNTGLKYETTIKLSLGETDAVGTVESHEIGAVPGKAVRFTASLSGDKIMAKFKGEPPIVGDASEWTDKPWILDKSGKKETLLITFNAKNYETNKWEDMKYEFTACK